MPSDVCEPSPTPATSVSTLLGDTQLQAAAVPGHVALLWEDGQRTYAELRDNALRLAAALRARGLETGDRVASFLMNRGETFELYFACAYAGLTFVPISFRLTATEVAMILGDCTPKILFTDTEHRAVVDEAIAKAIPGTPVVTLEPHGTGEEYPALIASAAPLTLSEQRTTPVQLILYTSGTTGRPKGVAMRHMNILWNAFQQVAVFRGLNRNAVMLITGPMYNTAGINESSIPAFLVGATVAILPSSGWTPERMGGYIDRFKATHTLLFPSMMRPLLDADERSKLPIESLRWVYTGGENCPPPLMKAWMERFPDKILAVAYGSTESGTPTIVEDEEILRYPGSVGRITPGQSVRILSAEGKVLGPNEIGEVWTSGPAVISAYWNAPDIDAVTIRDGWLKMGDLGRMDEHGHLYIVGRSKDMIISKSQNIYPAEVENALRAHPDVSDVAVVGVPDAEFGEAVCAAIIPRQGAAIDPDAVVEFVRTRLASYKKPRHIVLFDVFPRGLSGKVKKDELAASCRERLGL
ncbi:MAG: AMP-binding protein [Hyphomicrobiaceae bacterium]